MQLTGLWHQALDRGLGLGARALPESLRSHARNWYLNAVYFRLYPEKCPLQPADASPLESFRRYRRLLRGGSEVDLAAITTSCVSGLVSVVLPVYNQAKYVRGAIESVLAQEDVRFELIIVDDGSTDATPAIIDSYRNHHRIEVARQHNRGLPAALNAGFARASGELLTWTSADNIMPPRQLADQQRAMASRADLQAVYGDMQLIDADGSPLRNSTSFREFQCSNDGSVIRLPRVADRLHAAAYNFIGARFMYRAWTARVLGAYDEAWPLVEDYDYWLRLSAWFNIGHEGEGHGLYQYRIHSESLGSMKSAQVSQQTYSLLEDAALRRKAWLDPIPLHAGTCDESPFRAGRGFEKADGRERESGESVLWVVTSEDQWRHIRRSAHPQDVVVGLAYAEAEKARMAETLPDEAWLIEVGLTSRLADRHRVLGLQTGAPLSFLLRAIYWTTESSGDAIAAWPTARLTARY